jgi:hypothetical protein
LYECWNIRGQSRGNPREQEAPCGPKGGVRDSDLELCIAPQPRAQQISNLNPLADGANDLTNHIRDLDFSEMPYSYKIDTADKVIMGRGTGILNAGEILAVRQEIREDGEFNATFNRIIDLRDVTEISISVDDLRLMVGPVAYSKPSRIAFIANDDFKFGMTRMYTAFCNYGANDCQIFRDMTEARQWIMRASEADI